MAEHILALWCGGWEAVMADGYVVRAYGAYHSLDHPRPLHTRGLDELEEVDHSLCLQSLQLGMDADEGTCAAHAITAGRDRVVQSKLSWHRRGRLYTSSSEHL